MDFFKNFCAYLLAILLVVVIRLYVFAPTGIIGSSMLTTLADGDVTILDKIVYDVSDIERFDVVILKRDNGEFLVKRVIGLPFEYVEYIDNKLYINGELFEEPFLDSEAYTLDFGIDDWDYKVIPKGQYLVLGDNRMASKDSRYFGFVDASNIVGKARLVVYPFGHISIVK